MIHSGRSRVPRSGRTVLLLRYEEHGYTALVVEGQPSWVAPCYVDTVCVIDVGSSVHREQLWAFSIGLSIGYMWWNNNDMICSEMISDASKVKRIPEIRKVR